MKMTDNIQATIEMLSGSVRAALAVEHTLSETQEPTAAEKRRAAKLYGVSENIFNHCYRIRKELPNEEFVKVLTGKAAASKIYTDNWR